MNQSIDYNRIEYKLIIIIYNSFYFELAHYITNMNAITSAGVCYKCALHTVTIYVNKSLG